MAPTFFTVRTWEEGRKAREGGVGVGEQGRGGAVPLLMP
jgi:hypothetical protein